MIASIEVFIAKWGLRIALILSVVISIWYHGYTTGKESVTTKAAEKALKEEREISKKAVVQAGEDAARIAEAETAGETLRREYEEAPTRVDDPLNCISPEQRRVLQRTINGG